MRAHEPNAQLEPLMWRLDTNKTHSGGSGGWHHLSTAPPATLRAAAPLPLRQQRRFTPATHYEQIPAVVRTRGPPTPTPTPTPMARKTFEYTPAQCPAGPLQQRVEQKKKIPKEPRSCSFSFWTLLQQRE